MVCVSHTYSFIYLKTHKTASTSAEMALEPFCAPPDHVVKNRTRETIITPYGVIGARAGGKKVRSERKGRHLHNHMNARMVERVMGTLIFAEYQKVISVRNPYKRLYSQFLFQHQVKNIPLPATISEGRDRFLNAVEGAFEDRRFRTDRIRLTSDRNLVTLKGKFVVDAFLRAEFLLSDAQKFLKKCGSKNPESVTVPYHRKTKLTGPDWTLAEFYDDDRLVSAVRELDGWVFDLAGYSEHPEDTLSSNAS